MGKVASRSVEHAIIHAGVADVHHVHRINPDSGDPHAGLYNYFVERGMPGNIISPVREPIARNISAFFQNRRPLGLPLEASIKSFLTDYPQYIPLAWFPNELGWLVGEDFFALPFDQAAGHQTYHTDLFDILIFQVELPDARKNEILNTFLHKDNIRIGRRHPSKSTRYGAAYTEFLEKAKFPSGYIDYMLGAAYTQHFYSLQDIEKARTRWTNPLDVRIAEWAGMPTSENTLETTA